MKYIIPILIALFIMQIFLMNANRHQTELIKSLQERDSFIFNGIDNVYKGVDSIIKYKCKEHG